MNNNKSILFVGQAFYNAWYLSRELRKLDWKADLININTNEEFQKLYHGQDTSFSYTSDDLKFRLDTYINSLEKYNIFHFSNKSGIYFIQDNILPGRIKSTFPLITKIIAILLPSNLLKALSTMRAVGILRKDQSGNLGLTKFGYWLYKKAIGKWLFATYGTFWDIELLKLAGKKIGYGNNGCLDGALKSSFSKWGPINTCNLCKWKNHPEVCSDTLNTAWGEFRNRVADYQCYLGSNRVDFNDVPEVFESPWIYCMDTKFWNPDILIPSNYLLPFPSDIVKIYHAVGSFESRSDSSNRNIKCTHIYLALIEKFKKEGLPVELIFFHGIPNKVIRYYQAQADIVVDMLTYGFFGANIREAMMLGKPAFCYLRPEWLETMRLEIPEYVDELPIISATPDTIEEVLRELIGNKEKREEIGRLSRAFAVKWHGSGIAAQYFDKFLRLVSEDKLDRKSVFNIQKEIYN